MRRVFSSSMWLATWMLQLYSPAANIVTGFKATCVVPPVAPLGNTSLTCQFPEDVSKTKKNFIVDVVPEYGKTEVALNCFWVRNEMKCYTKEGYSFDGQVSDRITLQIPQVSQKQYGRYNCFFFNISSVYSEACVLEKTAGLSLKLPFYPGDTVMALEKKQLHIAFDLNGVKDRNPGDDVRVVVKKNHVDTLCDVIYVQTTGHVINRSTVSFCSSQPAPDLGIVFSMKASREDNGAILTWQIWRGGWFTGLEKSLLLNITSPVDGPTLKLPCYPGDVIRTSDKTQILVPFSVDGLHDSQYGDEVRVVVKKNGVDTLCDFIYAKARQQLMKRRSMSACTPASSPVTHLEFSINPSCEDNGAVLSWQVWMAGRLIDTEKSLLLSVTCYRLQYSYRENIGKIYFEDPRIVWKIGQSGIVFKDGIECYLKCELFGSNGWSLRRPLHWLRQRP